MSRHEIIKTGDVSVRIMELAKDAATDWHYHTEVEDFFVCLTGMVVVETRTPAGKTTLGPGQRTEVGPGKVHRVVNISSEKSEYLLVQGVGVYDFCNVR
jgi:mannose-6-phosphate isomerase-like protein (cupin superfamily)